MVQLKRRKSPHVYTPGQMLQILKAEPQFVALLHHSAVWMAVEPRTAWVLDMCCIGQLEGGPETAEEIAAAMGLVLSPPPPTPPQEPEQHPTQGVNHAMNKALRQTPWLNQPHRFLCIRLTLEETFFLHYVLRCLKVMSEAPKCTLACEGGGAEEQQPQVGAWPAPGTMRALNDQELWTACRNIRANFPVSYMGYHHLKCKGWLPRSGLLYGADYVAYTLHPAACHSLFVVVLRPLPPATTRELHRDGVEAPQDGRDQGASTAHEEEAEEVEVAGTYEMGWHDLQITSRLVSSVAKKLLMLYLYQAPDSPGHDTPACIKHYYVEERLVRRWVPDACRD